jgi:hypothetical protein
MFLISGVMILLQISRDLRDHVPTDLFEDNLADVVMSINPVRRKYSGHIDIRRQYVRELALAGLTKLIPLGTHDMVADVLTKNLPTPDLTCHREIMMDHQRFQSFYARSLRACYIVIKLCLLNLHYRTISHWGERLVVRRN